MISKPSDWFISVIDFFSIILPGAVVTYFLKGQLYDEVFGDSALFPPPDSEAQGWAVFLFVTYLVGNLIFLIGSMLDKIYDKVLREPFFKKNGDLAYLVATRTREQFLASRGQIAQLSHLGRLSVTDHTQFHAKKSPEILNTFKWAKHYLAAKAPTELVAINKLEADSKFFRSLVVAFFLMGVVLLWKHPNGIMSAIGVAASFVVLSLLCLYRYGELRYKSTESAYESVITLEHLTRKSESDRRAEQWDTRQSLIAPSSIVTAHHTRIATLTTGCRSESNVLAIPRSTAWEVRNARHDETLLCLSGTCVMECEQNDGTRMTAILAPNAIVPCAQGSSFTIRNAELEPLVLLAVK